MIFSTTKSMTSALLLLTSPWLVHGAWCPGPPACNGGHPNVSPQCGKWVQPPIANDTSQAPMIPKVDTSKFSINADAVAAKLMFKQNYNKAAKDCLGGMSDGYYKSGNTRYHKEGDAFLMLWMDNNGHGHWIPSELPPY